MFFALAFIFFHRLRPFQKMLREDLAHITGGVTEVFSGAQVVRAFGRERSETALYARDTNLLWRKNLHAAVLNIFAHSGVYALHWILNGSMWMIGGYYHLQGKLTNGELLLFFFFVQWMFRPIFMFMHSFADLQRSLACSERVFDLLDEPEDMPDAPDAVPITEFRDRIRFEQVCFSYPDGTKALNNINLDLPRGKKVALVGPSGSGKSTIANLLLRFYDVTSGRITLDGKPLRELKLAAYRKLFSLVLQDVFLFDGSIADNISYGKPGASLEEIAAAGQAANCTPFVEKLDNGYESLIGERGVKLSGGEKQRISLARAIIADPAVLILDEATSNLDSESENLIQDALDHILKNRTTLIIAHRFSTIVNADKIVVVEAGGIVEEGSHHELLARKSRYFELYQRQMSKPEKKRNLIVWQ